MVVVSQEGVDDWAVNGYTGEGGLASVNKSEREPVER